MSMYKWLGISALMFFGTAAAWLYDYSKSIEGPVSIWGDANLMAISGRPLQAECKKFSTLTGKFTFRKRFADPKVTFSYTYGGLEYLGERYSPTRKYDFYTAEECEELIRGFLKSQSVTIWVDPRNPSYAVLNPSLSLPWIGLSFMLIGGLVLVVAGGLKFFMRRAR
jgi:hypothetical protein